MCVCVCMTEREHTLPILKANVLPVWVQRTGLYKHNVSKRTDRQIEEGQEKKKTQGERRTEAFSLFTVSHGQQLLGHVSTLLTFA